MSSAGRQWITRKKGGLKRIIEMHGGSLNLAKAPHSPEVRPLSRNSRERIVAVLSFGDFVVRTGEHR